MKWPNANGTREPCAFLQRALGEDATGRGGAVCDGGGDEAGAGESASERDLQTRGFSSPFHQLASLSLSLLKKETKKKEPDSENGELEIGLQSSHVFWRKFVKSHSRQFDMKNQESCGLFQTEHQAVSVTGEVDPFFPPSIGGLRKSYYWALGAVCDMVRERAT